VARLATAEVEWTAAVAARSTNEPKRKTDQQTKRISDFLTANLDWNTFRLSEIGFGDVMIPVPDDLQHYETDVPMTFNGTDFTVHVEAGIRVASGEVYAAFYSLDPDTSLPPAVDIGFLPPRTALAVARVISAIL
jgi:hypothetical protein